MATLNLISDDAESVQVLFDSLAEVPVHLTLVSSDDHSVSVDLEVSDEDMPTVLHALEAFGDGPSLNGHRDPTA